MKDRVVACVIARLESSRLPRKVLADIGGHPLLKRLVDRLRLCDRIDDIVLCTSETPPNKELITRAREWGIQHHAGSDRDVLERIIEASTPLEANHLIRVTGDNVLTDPFYLSALVEQHLSAGAEYSRVNHLPLGISAEILSMTMARSLHYELKDPSETEYLLFYAFRPDRHKCIVLEPRAEHRRPTYAVTVDTPRDLNLARSLFAAFSERPAGPDIDQMIGWLDANVEERIELEPEAAIRMPHGRSMSFSDLLTELDSRASRSIRVRV